MNIFRLIQILLLASNSARAIELSLSHAIDSAMNLHPSVESATLYEQAESKKIKAQYFPENPMIGVMKDNQMKSWTLSQNIEFPSKYYYRAEAQKNRSQAAAEDLKWQKLDIRSKIISATYTYQAENKNLIFLKAQRDLLREIARIAENRRSTGAITAQDEMKAHLEQSKIENDILDGELLVTSAEENLKQLMGIEDTIQIEELPRPTLKKSLSELKMISTNSAPILAISHRQVDEANALKNIATSSFLPDFNISLQKSMEKGVDDKSIAIELKLPIWFLAKETSEYSSASANKAIAQQKVILASRELQFLKQSLIRKIESKNQILKLYETTLLPQSQSALNSSRAAYTSGRVNFIELLDTERTTYQLKTAYYREMKELSETIAEFEKNFATSISSLPWRE